MPRQPEIQNLHAAFPRQHDILRLEIPVHDAGGVRGRETLGHLRGDLNHSARRQGPLGNGVAQRFSIHQLGHDISGVPFAPHIVNRNDVGMIQRAGGARFPLESNGAAEARPRPSSGRIFSATSRPSRASRARYTSPIPPAPICARIS